MKKAFIAALTLTAAFALATGAPVPASAAETLSPTTTQDLGGGLTYDYYEQTYGSGTQKIYTATVDTKSENSEYDVVVHAIPHASGNGFLASYVTDIAKDYEERTGRKVYAGINADFFATSGGVTTPQQAYAQDGKVLYQGPNYGTGETKRSFGFDNNGNSVIGQLTETSQIIKVTTSKGGERFFPVKINAVPEEGGVSVFTTSATAAVMQGTGKYVSKITEGSVDAHNAVATSQRMSAGSIVDDNALSLRSGELAIVVKGENEVSQWFYDNYKYGSTVAFTGDAVPGGIFEGMEQIVGGWADLVNGGTVISQATLGTYVTPKGRGLTEYADRSFFGVTEDGTFVLCAVDGRNANGSKGLTVMEEANLAYELGLYTAIELDGGGSTTMILRENDEIVQKNFSSQGSNNLGEGKAGARKVCNAILVVEKVKAEEPHSHTYAEEWSWDEASHWHAATCEHEGEKTDAAEHDFGDDDVCDICGYRKPTVSPPSEEDPPIENPPEEEPPMEDPPSENPPKEPAEKKGCFGAISAGQGAVTLTLILTAAWLVIRKRKTWRK